MASTRLHARGEHDRWVPESDWGAGDTEPAGDTVPPGYVDPAHVPSPRGTAVGELDALIAESGDSRAR